MTKRTKVQKRKAESISYAISGFGLIIIFIILVVYPAKKQSSSLNKEINALDSKIKRQEVLNPSYTQLLIKNKEIEKQIKEIESTGFESFLNHNNLLKLPDSFKEIASKSKMKMISCSPDINSSKNNKNKLLLNLELEGDFLDFPNLLSAFEAEKKITYLESIEISSEKTKTYLIKLWLNMDKQL
ncbi:MAG: hypothetical protein RBR53_02785 [Desulforegulaceae bacterium]|nr:hypothetical protein [Desulforegulaceae bacterium]